MKNREFYTQKIPQEEIERLKQMEYPNFVSETLFDNIDLKGKNILDIGAGSNPNLAEFVFKRGAKYIPLDVRTDVLEEMKKGLASKGFPFYGVQGDVKRLPFSDKEFDIIHQRFVLMNIKPSTHKKALEEILKVGKEYVLLLEYNWETLKSTENPEIIKRFRNSAFEVFKRFSVDPFMGKKFKELLNEVDPGLEYSIKHFVRKESENNTPELILNLCGFYRTAKDMLKNDNLAEEFNKLLKELKKMPIKFVPPKIVAVIIKK